MRFLLMPLDPPRTTPFTCAVCDRDSQVTAFRGDPPIVDLAVSLTSPPETQDFCIECSTSLLLQAGKVVSDHEINSWRKERGLPTKVF
jgi:hypothetical protein